MRREVPIRGAVVCPRGPGRRPGAGRTGLRARHRPAAGVQGRQRVHEAARPARPAQLPRGPAEPTADVLESACGWAGAASRHPERLPPPRRGHRRRVEPASPAGSRSSTARSGRNTYDFVASRFMVKRDLGGGRIAWLEAGWAETGWAGPGRQHIYTFNTNTKTWQFYDQYQLKPGDRIWLDLHTDGEQRLAGLALVEQPLEPADRPAAADRRQRLRRAVRRGARRRRPRRPASPSRR